MIKRKLSWHNATYFPHIQRAAHFFESYEVPDVIYNEVSLYVTESTEFIDEVFRACWRHEPKEGLSFLARCRPGPLVSIIYRLTS